ncbi:LysR substrate-binding domain-containing protein [Pseudonocardia halophobica]|uniref:LysR family transcriptional regulator n=1 Tax=Pseudonocardia halophobica TaxID=29401 RepID=A0A9W6NX46_9PSEU|nr:LysR family transcriptional regulator [Pseudonocardia halophobica]GLL12251.1 LysR family transcriptional regulator [Pseudonocardia halophobica]
MEIRQFEYFAAIAREGSFSRAARVLHVSQPALSKQIQALEHELGVQLLIRDAEGVRPTAAGARLDELSEILLDLVAGVPQAVRAAATELVGTVTVGLAPSLAPVLSDQLRTALGAAHPKMGLHIVEAPPMFLMERLEAGRLDVGLFSRWPPHDENPRLRYTDLGADEVVLVGTPELLRPLHKGPVEPAALRGLPLALTPGYRDLWRRMDLAAAPDDLGIEIDSIHLVERLVLRGEYVSALPASYVQDAVASGELKALSFEPPLRRHVAAVTRAGRGPSAAAEAVTAIARARMAELTGR